MDALLDNRHIFRLEMVILQELHYIMHCHATSLGFYIAIAGIVVENSSSK